MTKTFSNTIWNCITPVTTPSTHSFSCLIEGQCGVGLNLAWQRWRPPKTSLWARQPWIPGCYPYCRRKWCDGGGKGVERVENKAINVIGCLDRGQSEDRRREGRKNRKRGRERLSSSLLSALWRGQEDAKSVGRLCTGSQHVCEDPSVYLSVPICPLVPC